MTKLVKIILLTLSAVIICAGAMRGQNAHADVKMTPELERMLSTLDSLLARTPEFIREKEERLARLRSDYKGAGDTERRYWLASALYDEYCAYDSDSAMCYVDRAQCYARELGRRDLVNEMELNRSYLYSATGLLDEASESLRKINPDSLPPTLALKYCDRMLFLSTHRDQYMGVERETEMYSMMIDSLLQATVPFIKPDNPNYCWLTGWSNLNTIENARKAIPTVAKIVDATDYATRSNAMDAWVLAKLYERVGDDTNRLKYLILSAQADVRASNKEIASLEELTSTLFAMGDLERANNYINYCISYANDYKSRIRLGALAKIQEQTLGAIHERIEQQARTIRLSLIGLAIFLLILILTIFYIMRQNKLLRNSRATLNDANVELSNRVEELQSTREELKTTNSKLSDMYETARQNLRELAKVNDTNEEYIASVFVICSNYINKYDEFRANLHKLLTARKFEEAARMAKSPELSYDEVKELYANFDKIFLELYPDFLDDFNSLLRPEERIELRKPGKLTTELRIYALVRLGLNDSVKIAEFLHCSPQTVYNTRQRTRNKSAIPRDEFAERVRSLGKPTL